MALDQATIDPLVSGLEGAAGEAWTQAQRDTLISQLQSFSAALVPHIVEDVVITASERQTYLLMRLRGALDDLAATMAAGLRKMYQIDGLRYREDDPELSLGIRSASRSELEALDGVGEVLAAEIARFLSFQKRDLDIRRLTEIDGIGEERLAEIVRQAYLDQPTVTLVSEDAVSFCTAPSFPSMVSLVASTGLVPFFGDQTTMARRGILSNSSVFEKVTQFLNFAVEQASNRSFPASGDLASKAKAQIKRMALREQVLGNTSPVAGEIVVNDAYVGLAKELIDASSSSIELMLFLGTTVSGVEDRPGPLTLVEALEAAHDRGVSVRVILDQDDGGVPYKSAIINQPLLNRLEQRGVPVKLDDEKKLLHSKVLICDSTTTIVGSHNWTRAGFFNTHEVSVLLESSVVASEFQNTFDGLWLNL